MGRIFWIAVGAGTAVYVMYRARKYLAAADPQVIGNRVAAQLSAGVQNAQNFVDRVRAATAESEAEIRSTLGLPQD